MRASRPVPWLPGCIPAAGSKVGLFWLVAAVALVAPDGVQGVPYASGLTSIDGVISFRLNQPAHRVWLVQESETGSFTNEFGPLGAGLHSFSRPVSGVFRIGVWNQESIGFVTPVTNHQTVALRISPDGNVLTRFASPCGIAIDTHPASPWFGRVYVANSQAGQVTNALFGPERTVGDGLYALDADLTDGLAQGDTARTCGLDFMTNSDRAPYRLTTGRWGEVYVCDTSDTNGSLYAVDGDLSPHSGGNVLAGPAGGRFPVGLNASHGSISAAAVTGSLLESTLVAYVIDEDLQSDPASGLRSMLNSLWEHDVWQQTPEQTTPPTLLVRAPWFALTSQIMDLSRGTNGYSYVNNYRARGDLAGLHVHNAAGEALWNSLDATRTLLNQADAIDLLVGTGGGAISPDDRFTAVMSQDTGMITVLPLVDGLPDLQRRLTFMPFVQTNGGACDLGFDAADNLYVISSAAQALRVFSAGGTTMAITGSDGTFELVRPPQITVSTPSAMVTEGATTSATFVLHRTGDTNQELRISFQLGGTATADLDYSHTHPSLPVVLPAGATELELPFRLRQDDLTESIETLTLSVAGSASYDLGFPSSASCAILDDEAAKFSITLVKSNAQERLPADRIVFDIERVGQTSLAVEVGYDLTEGTATAGVDFTGPDEQPLPATLRFGPGQLRQRLELQPRNDDELEGSERVVLRLLAAATYELGEPHEATGWIRDDETRPLPETSVLFADDFEQDTESNWIVRFGANNGIYDATVLWAFDYSALGIPPAPGAAPDTTSGLLVQLNTTNPAAGGSAGINFYPKNWTSSGNFALRFEAFIHLGMPATTEHLLAGINHSRLYTNRVTRSHDTLATTRGGDGIWLALSSDGAEDLPRTIYTLPDPGSLPQLVTNQPIALTEIFPSPPYSRPGSPSSQAFSASVWTEVEFSQIRDVLTVKLNNQVVFSFPNPTPFTQGAFMIGWNDQFDSVGAPGFQGTYAVFDNVRVVSYEPALIAIRILDSEEFALDFFAPGAVDPSELEVEVSPDLVPPHWRHAPATISQVEDQFRAVVDRHEGPEFFRIRHRPR